MQIRNTSAKGDKKHLCFINTLKNEANWIFYEKVSLGKKIHQIESKTLIECQDKEIQFKEIQEFPAYDSTKGHRQALDNPFLWQRP